jgi:GT2 family glycosyltransferase
MPLVRDYKIDATFRSVNHGRFVEIPTAVGFCMYIRRGCLQETGFFDVQSFGLGYGEENDFCMRAAQNGWKHKLACDVFVYHVGSVSFGGAVSQRQSAMRVLIKKISRLSRSGAAACAIRSGASVPYCCNSAENP